MLEIFRNKGISSVIYGVVIIGTVAAFVINFGPNSGRQSKGISDAFHETCAVKIGNACVDPKIHRGSYRLLMPRDRDGVTDVNRARSMGLSKIVGEGLVERELLIREAERIGLTVTAKEVEDTIVDGYIHVSVPSDNPMVNYYLRTDGGRLYAGFKDPKTKLYSYKTYEKQVKMLTGVSEAEFRLWQERELLAAKMRDLVRSPVRLADEEVFSKYVREKSLAGVTYVEVKPGFAQRFAVKDSPAEVEAWMKDEGHKKQVEAELLAVKEQFAPKEGHIRHILVRLSPGASDDEKNKAAEKLGRAMARIASGDAFASVARTFSDDTSNMTGGDVGDKTDGFVPSFRDAANALKPGELTDGAIESQFGYHVIYRDDPKKADAITAQLKKDFARQAYLKAKSKEAAQAIATQIMVAVKSGTTEDAAIKGALARFTGFKVPALPSVKVKLMAKEPAAQAPTAKPSDAGVSDAGSNAVDASGKAPSATADTFITLTPKASDAENDAERPKLETPATFARGSDPITTLQGEDAPKVLEFAFRAKPAELYPDLLRGEDNFFVLRAKERKDATKEDFEKNRDGYVEELLKEKKNEALGLYVKRLREAAKNEIKFFDENMVDAKTDAGASKASDDDDDGP